MTALQAMASWQQERPLVRYADLLLHPGMGTGSKLRLRLYEVAAPGGPVRCCVTEDADFSGGKDAVAKALARWQACEYDPVTPGGSDDNEVAL